MEAIPRLAGVVVAAMAGAMINSIAGGGTLLTFPSLVALGVPPLIANATSTVALWPGVVTSMYGYRSRLQGTQRWATVFAVPSLLGGATGALLLLRTPADRFDTIVPWLVLSATALFAIQGPVMQAVRRRSAGGVLEPVADGHVIPSHSMPALFAQFAIAVYGGYFGAGMGILILAVLGFLGFTDIHRMNGLKNWAGLCINFVAAALFVVSGIVDWTIAITMAVGAMLGGYLASRLAQRVPQRFVRHAILAVGLGSGIWLLFQ